MLVPAVPGKRCLSLELCDPNFGANTCQIHGDPVARIPLADPRDAHGSREGNDPLIGRNGRNRRVDCHPGIANKQPHLWLGHPSRWRLSLSQGLMVAGPSVCRLGNCMHQAREEVEICCGYFRNSINASKTREMYVEQLCDTSKIWLAILPANEVDSCSDPLNGPRLCRKFSSSRSTHVFAVVLFPHIVCPIGRLVQFGLTTAVA